MVIVNPYQSLETLNDSTLELYADVEYEDLSEKKPSLRPHVYQLAARMYFCMRRTGEDQSLILSGITGSGKTTTRKHFLSELLHLSARRKSEKKLCQRIESAQTILELFGHASTVENTSSSKYNLFQEVQISKHGRVLGSRLLTYQFSKTRVTNVQPNERSFHVFYALLSGTTMDEKNALHINHRPDYFNYLNQSGCLVLPNWNDEIQFGNLIGAFKTCGFKTKSVTQIFQLLASILHIGNLQFVESSNFVATSKESCIVKNTDVLDTIAAILGVSSSRLEICLTYKLRMIGKEICTIFLDPEAATDQRDIFARTLYSVLFLWITETINQAISSPEQDACTLNILDQTGFQNSLFNGFDEFCANIAGEHLQYFLTNAGLNKEYGLDAEMVSDGIDIPSIGRDVDYFACLGLFLGETEEGFQKDTEMKQRRKDDSTLSIQRGLAGLLNKYTVNRQNGATDATDANFLGSLQRQFPNQPSLCKNHQIFAFGIKHFCGSVDYSVNNFLESNLDEIPPDFISLLKDNSSNEFVSSLFNSDTISTTLHPKDHKTIVKAQVSTNTMRNLSLRKKLMETSNQSNEKQNEKFDRDRVQSQVRALLIPKLCVRHRVQYAHKYTFEDFVSRYRSIIAPIDQQIDNRKKVENVLNSVNWSSDEVFVGRKMIWLRYGVWKKLEDYLRTLEKEEGSPRESFPSKHIKPAPINQHPLNREITNDNPNLFSEYGNESSSPDDSQGICESGKDNWEEEPEWNQNNSFGPNMDMSKMIQDVSIPQVEHVENIPITCVRIWWVRFTWLVTFWIPSLLLSWFGKMHRPDIQMAWREKVALCSIIAFISAVILFIIVGLGEVVCPDTGKMYSIDNVRAHGISNDNYMSIRGMVYDMTKFSKTNHGIAGKIADNSAMTDLAGYDLSSSIPPPLTLACSGLVFDASIRLMANTSANPQASFVHYSGDQLQFNSASDMSNSHWYWDTFLPSIKEFKKGILVHNLKDLESDANSWSRAALAINGRVYDIQDYITTVRYYGQENDAYDFLPNTVKDVFTHFSGTDATSKWERYKVNMTNEEEQQVMDCLNNYFFIGYVDPRTTARCMFTNYILLVCAVLMCTVILVKFISALQFGSTPVPEDHDKFVICQIPCYTEGEESIKKTINSLSVMNYDDKRKLLFIIADGMVMGSGNDRTTPRIVLDVLGCTRADPEPQMFKSVGEGSKQLNYGKVYSGLYECEGHTVPYIVVVKVGKASERTKPGNRGKRDSQMICMSFLNRVHYNSEMNPLELEIYYQINNVIGINPACYEYILMVDSDTEVLSHSLSYLISSMLHDGRIMGLCGETALLNENKSWITMIQVYEYYISHYLAKAFESLFGSVTCLPGCFCMYRLKTPVKNEPLIISSNIVREYSENRVDTLHKRNLLSLGEDRYLTTLMMKYFPERKMKFTPYAMCRTVAPDDWRVLLSQRRRWINSTIHNLLEVVLLPDLCGFCCFSMRFVVLIDLIGTLTLPVSFCYLIYLVYVMAAHAGPFPTLAIGMLGGIYALQIVIFVLKKQWQHIGWMFFYIFALPVYSFFLPVYSFWHFDDFSWGNTRVVVGERQRKIIVTDDEEFDEKMIPMKKWLVYEQELWNQGLITSKLNSCDTAFYDRYGMGLPAYSTNMTNGYMYYNLIPSQPSFTYNNLEETVSSTTGSESSSEKTQKANKSRTTMTSGLLNPAHYPYTMQHIPHTSHNSFMNQSPYFYTTRLPSSYEILSPQIPSDKSSNSLPRADSFTTHNGALTEQRSSAHLLNDYSKYAYQEFPSDEKISKEIEKIIDTSDLMQITKKKSKLST
ncbi:hypothetical protein G6F56_000557 [Rhizopus delemar]|nr:hypothetical protein G6F56_000557 [Rhizopus delemar]